MSLSEDIPEHVLVKLLAKIDVFNTVETEPLRATALVEIKDILAVHFPHISQDTVVNFVLGMAKGPPQTPPARPFLNLKQKTHPVIPPPHLPSPLEHRPPLHRHCDFIDDQLRSRMLPFDGQGLDPAEVANAKLWAINQSIKCRMEMERRNVVPLNPTLTPVSPHGGPSLSRSTPLCQTGRATHAPLSTLHTAPSYITDRIIGTQACTAHTAHTARATRPAKRETGHSKYVEAGGSRISQRLAELSMLRRMSNSQNKDEDEDEDENETRIGHTPSRSLNNLNWMNGEEKEYYRSTDTTEQDMLQQLYGNLQNVKSCVPIRFRVLLSDIPEHTKATILKKLELMASPFESAKYMGWLETLLSVPFGKINPLPVSSSSTPGEITDYIVKCKQSLDQSVLGHDTLKDVLACVIASWIRTDGNATVVNALGIKGPIGVGKTTIIRSGLAKAVDRPFAFISCGGSSGSSLLNGHSFTYEGSLPGAIVEAVMSTGCTNPIILLDEVDKISTDAKGEEVFNTLLHLLDPSQNTEFQDRFLNVPLDISKAFFVLTYNDASRIPVVLRDRLLEVEVHDFGTEEKVDIATGYLLPDILTALGLPLDWMNIEADAMKHIIGTTGGTGMRSTRHALINIVSTLNMLALSGERAIELFSAKTKNGSDNVFDLFKHVGQPPFHVTKEMVENIMSRIEQVDKVASMPTSMYS